MMRAQKSMRQITVVSKSCYKVRSEKHMCFTINTETENCDYFLRKVSAKKIVGTRHSAA